MPLPDNPITRREIYLASIAAKNTELPAFPITREEQYLDYIARHDGSSVVSDYDDLTDKPLINSNTLSGDKAGNDLGLLDLSGGTMDGTLDMGGNPLTGLPDGVEGSDAITKSQFDNALDEKQDALDFPELTDEMTQPVAVDANNALWTANYKEQIYDTRTALSVALFGDWHENEYETHEVTLTNSAAQPFNTTLDSPVSVPLTVVRANLYYTVEYEITAHTGLVGEVIISDKALNGFKVSFTGSATSVTLTLRIKGGIK